MLDFPPRGGLIPAPVPQDEWDTLFREIERSAEIGGYIWEPNRRLVWSDGLFRLMELEPGSEIGGAVFFDRVHPEDRARVALAWQHSLSGEVHPTRYRIVRLDGSVRHMRGHGTVTRAADGSVARIVGSIIDVTDIHETAERLAGANASLAETQSVAGVGSYVFDVGNQRLEWSGMLYELMGVDPSVCPTLEFALGLIHPDDRERHIEWVERLLAGELVAPSILRVVRPDSRVVHLENRGRRIVADGGAIRLLGISFDVTSRVQLEERLQQAAKMEAVGTLAAGVAHDFNNYLTVILFHLEELRHTNQGGNRSPLQDALHAAEQCALLTRQLLAFGRKQPSAMRDLNLGALVVSLGGLLRRLCRSDIAIDVDLPPSPLIVEADAGQLESVLMNLAVNARDAMPLGGAMRFSFEEFELTAADPVLEPGNPPGRYTCLRLTDTGTGISPEHLPRIFEPYFSTKDAGRGTGLGLASVYGIVRQHGGFVRVESQLKVGTTFSVYLRSKTPEGAFVQPPPASPTLAPPPLHGLRILVAEDVEAVRRTVVSGLARAGACVAAAEDGLSALGQLTSGLHVDLVLTDLIMPRMGGIEFAREVRKLKAWLPIVFMTGYVDRDAMEDIALDDSTSPILYKPFTIEELVRTVAAAVERQRGKAAHM